MILRLVPPVGIERHEREPEQSRYGNHASRGGRENVLPFPIGNEGTGERADDRPRKDEQTTRTAKSTCEIALDASLQGLAARVGGNRNPQSLKVELNELDAERHRHRMSVCRYPSQGRNQNCRISSPETGSRPHARGSQILGGKGNKAQK